MAENSLHQLPQKSRQMFKKSCKPFLITNIYDLFYYQISLISKASSVVMLGWDLNENKKITSRYADSQYISEMVWNAYVWWSVSEITCKKALHFCLHFYFNWCMALARVWRRKKHFVKLFKASNKTSMGKCFQWVFFRSYYKKSSWLSPYQYCIVQSAVKRDRHIFIAHTHRNCFPSKIFVSAPFHSDTKDEEK